MSSNEDVVSRLSQNESLLDTLIQIEDYFDSLDLYVFENWIEGEVVDGPWVRRYWVELSLKYPYKLMPNPEGTLRLAKYGSRIAFKKVTEETTIEVEGSDDLDQNNRPKVKNQKFWLIEIRIPRRFIDELGIDDLDIYDDDVDAETISTAQDENIDDESGFEGGSEIEDSGEDPESGGDELNFDF